MANERTKALLDELFTDSDKDGVPDLFADAAKNDGTVASFITVNGKQYENIESLPPEIKEMITDAFGMVNKKSWMKTIMNGGLNIMPEMSFGKSEAIEKENRDNKTRDTFIEDLNPVSKPRLDVKVNWIYLVLIIIGLIAGWWLGQQ